MSATRGDGSLINDDQFMARFYANIKELKDYNFPIDHHFYLGDAVKIDGVLHVWDGKSWANTDGTE
jgi:hypothetical protein